MKRDEESSKATRSQGAVFLASEGSEWAWKSLMDMNYPKFHTNSRREENIKFGKTPDVVHDSRILPTTMNCNSKSSPLLLQSLLLLQRNLRYPINPLIVPRSPIGRQENILWPAIRRYRRISQHLGNITRRLRLRVRPRPSVLVRRHERVLVHPRRRRGPDNVPRGQDAPVKVAVHENRAVGVVPGAAQGALPFDGWYGGLVVSEELGRVDVYAVFVGEGSVGALPGGDAAAAVPQGEGRVRDVQRAEAVEEVGLPGNDGVIEVGVA